MGVVGHGGEFDAKGCQMQRRIVIIPDAVRPVTHVPVAAGAKHVRPHGAPKGESPLGLHRIAPPIMADRDSSLSRDTRLGRVRQAQRPTHPSSIFPESRLGIVIDDAISAPVGNGPCAVGERLGSESPGEQVGTPENVVVHLRDDERFMRPQALSDELGRRHGIELVGIDTGDPVPRAKAVTDTLDHVRAQRIEKDDRPTFQRHDAGIDRGVLVHDFPGLIGAAGIEDVDRVGPGTKVMHHLIEDVCFIANDEKGVKTHTGRISENGGAQAARSGVVHSPRRKLLPPCETHRATSP